MQKVVPYQGSVAQWIRRLPTEQEIVGSSPAWVNPFESFFKCQSEVSISNVNHAKSFYPYLFYFGNIQERHYWKKNPEYFFMWGFLWRHISIIWNILNL